MHPILFNESFFFCPRDYLERLQLLSRSLLDMIVAGSNVLPLRSIDRVEMGCDDAADKIQFYIQDDAKEPDYEASIDEGDFPETFRRLRYTCVTKFKEAAVFTVVIVHFRLADDTDYDVLDSIVNHLRPRTTVEVYLFPDSWHKYGHNRKRLKLLDRESFLNNLQTCRLNDFGNAFPAPAFFLEEPGYPNYELGCDGGQVADGIDRFIESFVRDGCANEKLESVCIQWREWDSTPSLMPKQLSKSTKINMPLPKNDLSAWVTRYAHEVTQCETQSFVNKKQWKRMEVYLWTVEFYPGRCCCMIYLLQCLVKNA
ncbi:hypothetical protein AAVH_24957 [Aphelenchoides avenae]|nr:hypothetical protein AAVH_24957 [Aphelenchus avenae]